MKRATIYMRKKQLLIHASSRTTDGVWILSEPCLAVPLEDNRGLQRAIRLALEASRTDVPHPRVWSGLLDPLLALAGVKSWNTFSKGASCVEVEESRNEIAIIPMKNLGPEDGFQADTARQVTLHVASDDLGDSVQRLLMQTP